MVPREEETVIGVWLFNDPITGIGFWVGAAMLIIVWAWLVVEEVWGDE